LNRENESFARNLSLKTSAAPLKAFNIASFAFLRLSMLCSFRDSGHKQKAPKKLNDFSISTGPDGAVDLSSYAAFAG